MWLRAAFALGVFTLTVSASAPVGIPRELAIARAAVISDLRYQLSFDLMKSRDAAPGTEELRFRLSRAEALLLDFRGDNARELVINGHATPVP